MLPSTRFLICTLACCCCMAPSTAVAMEAEVRDGTFTATDDDGTVRARATYKRGELIGPVSFFDAKGKADGQGDYPRTRAEVRAFLDERWPRDLGRTAYDPPAKVKTAWQVAGVSDEQHDQALALLNTYRWLAGVPDDVERHADYEEKCAKGALVIAALGGLSHRPPKPEGMPDDLYKPGYEACSKSNLFGWNQASFASMVHWFVWDGDPHNEKLVGHRRWVLNPTMAKTGFGGAGMMGVMWAVDKSRKQRWDYVSWPGSGHQPVELVANGAPWSLQFDRDRYKTPGESLELIIERLDHAFKPVATIGTTMRHIDDGYGTTNCCVSFRPELPKGLLIAAASGNHEGHEWYGLPGEVLIRVRTKGMKGKRRTTKVPEVDVLVHLSAMGIDGGVRMPWQQQPKKRKPKKKAGDEAPAAEADPEPAADAHAPAVDPAPEEIAVIELVNRYRRGPGADARRMVPIKDHLMVGSSAKVDWEVFLKECDAIKPAPPVLFDQTLLDAARAHGAYMNGNRVLGHVQRAGDKGFTGADPQARAVAAGWKGGVIGENVVGPAYGIWNAHCGFIIDWTNGDKPGDHGMQAGRGHRVTMSRPGWDVVGVCVVPDSQQEHRPWIGQSFGASGVRRAGGVVFIDRDADDCYDPGEGQAGVTVSFLDDAGRVLRTTTGTAHGWWQAPLPEGAARVQVAWGKDAARVERRYPVTAGTMYLRSRIADERRVKACLRAAKDLASAQEEPRHRRAKAERAALVEIALTALDFEFDGDAAKTMAPARQALEAAPPEVLEELDALIARYDKADARGAGSQAKRLQRTWRDGTIADWLEQFVELCEAYQAVDPIVDAAGKRRAVRPAKVDDAREAATDLASSVSFPRIADRCLQLTEAMSAVMLKR